MPFLHALAFFTRLPLPACAHGAWRVGLAAWTPVVGLVVGGCAALTTLGAAHCLPAGIAAILGVAAWALITGGLHLDGVADCGDGLLSAAPDKEKRLEIMRDPRIGAFGAIALLLLLLLKIAALAHLAGGTSKRLWVACLLAGVVARTLAIMALATQPMAKAGGLGEAFRRATRPWETGVALGLGLAAALTAFELGFPWPAVAAVLASLGVGAALAFIAKRQLGGLTGDVLGALIEGAEAAVLLAFCASY